jgi:hypothetical protein
LTYEFICTEPVAKCDTNCLSSPRHSVALCYCVWVVI